MEPTGWQLGYDPNRIAYGPYRTFRPPGSHPRPSHWEQIRRQALERDGHQCRCCSAKDGDEFPGYGAVRLEVHHRHYSTWGEESVDDVTVLCKECHRAVTDRFMWWRDKAREVRFEGSAQVSTELLPSAAPKGFPLPVVQGVDIESLPTAAPAPLSDIKPI